MFVKIKFERDMSLLELARFCGTAPCTILSANCGGVLKCSESDLVGREIFVPVSTPHLIRNMQVTYAITERGIEKIQNMV